MSKCSDDRREQRRREAQREAARVKRELQCEVDRLGKDGKSASSALTDLANAYMLQMTHAGQWVAHRPGGQGYQRYLPRWESAAPSPEPEQPPLTFSECVIGYRSWLVDATGQLRAVTMTKQTWTPGINVAKCRPRDSASAYGVYITSGYGDERDDEQHPAPHEDCNCGLYAYNDFQVRQPDWTGDCDEHGRLFAVGAIAAWGDLRVHADGFRASHACPVALAYPSSIGDRARNVLERVAAEYRVALVHVDTLQAEAEQHGTPLPVEARPKARELESPFTFRPSAVRWQSGSV